MSSQLLKENVYEKWCQRLYWNWGRPDSDPYPHPLGKSPCHRRMSDWSSRKGIEHMYQETLKIKCSKVTYWEHELTIALVVFVHCAERCLYFVLSRRIFAISSADHFSFGEVKLKECTWLHTHPTGSPGRGLLHCLPRQQQRLPSSSKLPLSSSGCLALALSGPCFLSSSTDGLCG